VILKFIWLAYLVMMGLMMVSYSRSGSPPKKERFGFGASEASPDEGAVKLLSYVAGAAGEQEDKRNWQTASAISKVERRLSLWEKQL